MYHPLLIAVISLIGATCASDIADGLNDDQNETHLQSHQELTQVYVNFWKTLEAPFCTFRAITRLKNYIFILCWREWHQSIRVYEDTSPFDLLMLITLEEINIPFALASSAASECLYVAEVNSSCIWKIHLEDHRLTKWLCTLGQIRDITVSTDDQVVVLQRNKTSDIVENIVEIYGSDAAFIRRIYLPNDNNRTFKVIIKPNGHFIIAHRVKGKNTLAIVIGIRLVTINGQIIDQVYVIGAFLETAAGKKICWSLHSDAARANDLDLKYLSECTITPRSKSHLIMLEGHIIPMLIWNDKRRPGMRDVIMLDVQLSFGIYSTKHNLIIHEYFRP